MDVFNNIYVYDVSVFSDPEEFNKAYAKMDPQRKEKIDRFRNDSDKYLSLGAGMLLKTVLSDAGLGDCGIEIAGSGKPMLVGRGNAFFNLSHSGKYAVLALSDKAVGIDVEKNKSFKKSLIEYVYDAQEQAFVTKLLEGAEAPGATCTRDKDALYTGLWTAKESVMKYFGIGLGMDPRKIHIEMNEEMKLLRATHVEADCSNLFIHRYELGDYQISVCTEHETYGGIVPVG